ncbi:MAG: DUF2752 domain-containing protein [Bacteroidales bacterium]|nr:DUF2752 domain-containing protein [Bacteroidales bacterium]MBN2758827.1 DUF2752 domain-containing protein [Bacteroidales bacterium]
MNTENNKKTYLLINSIFLLIILLIIIYSFQYNFNNSFKLKSLCSDYFGNNCISKGLSRAFSQIVKGNFSDAKFLNPYSLKIFLFFILQFLLRILSSIAIKNNFSIKKILLTDVIFSFCFFLYCFFEFILNFFFLLIV